MGTAQAASTQGLCATEILHRATFLGGERVPGLQRCSEPHPSSRTAMLRIPSALASHAFYSVPC